MQANLKQSIKKIVLELSKLGTLPKSIIKYGAWIFLGVFAFGTLLIVLNRTVYSYDLYYEFLAINIIKASFTLLAEAVIGGILIDFFMKKLS